MATSRRYVLWFAQEHVDFRKAEIFSLAKLFGIELKNAPIENDNKPFWIIELTDKNVAKKLASRSVSLRCILELWSHSNQINQLHENLKNYIKNNSCTIDKYFNDVNKTFKINVETYNKHFTQAEKLNKIDTFDYLPIQGTVKLKNPDYELWYIEFYGLNPKDVPEEPYDVIFGRWVADGQRNLIKELSLKQRKFIGNTSMDAQLSIFMANQALVQNGDLVYDPFVGSGSLLVSAAKFGGYVIGSDIDYMMLHAKSRPSRITQKIREHDESVKMNLKQYGCDKFYIDVLVSDFSNPLWHSKIEFDSIITDPPYGIREAIEKIEYKISTKSTNRSADTPHYPSTSHYSLEKLYFDLLKFSVNHLKIGGRLVCWVPVHRKDYSEKLIPQHDGLKLISNSEQILSSLTARRLLTYEKIQSSLSNTEHHNNVKDNNDDDETSFMINNMSNCSLIDFRKKYFTSFDEQTRKERRLKKAELKEIGRQEAIKRGKIIDINGKVINNKR